MQNIWVGALPTTFPDMEVRTGTNTAQMSTILIWIGVAGIIGVMLIGPLFDKVNGLLLLAFCFLMTAIFGGISPTWPYLLSFQALVAAANVFLNSTDSGKL